MSTLTLPSPTASPTDIEGLLHLVCPYECDNNLAFCGLDVSGEDWADEGDECVVCVELDELPSCASPTCPGRAA